MISQTAQYALRAVVHLAAQPAERQTSAAEAAAAIGVPERYLARVLNALAHGGVLRSTRGARGGFRLARPPAELTLAEVVSPFDDIGGVTQCLLRGQACSDQAACSAHDGWRALADDVRKFFQTTTIADLVESGAVRGPASRLAHPEGHLGTSSHPLHDPGGAGTAP
jgi:Rrf2 family protein